VLFALGMTRAIVDLMPDFYKPNEARIELNVYVLVFSACVSALTGILFGLAPALKCSRPDLVDALKDAGRSLSGGGAGGRTRQALVIAEITLSVVLLMGASLTVRGFLNLQALDPGFRTDRVLMVNLQLPPKRYPSYQQRIAFSERVLAAMTELPGVRSAAIGNGGLPFGGPRSPYSIVGQPNTGSQPMLLGLISADYPRTMGIPLRAGRELNAQEVARATPVAMINESAAKLWPAGTSPIGAQIHFDVLEKANGAVLAPSQPRPVVTVVGVIADTRNAGLRNPPVPAAYLPYTLVAPPGRTLALRTQIAPESLLNAVREKLRGIDKDQPLTRPLTLDDILGFETQQPRFNMALFVFFGLLGLALATIGIYSMLSYSVARRTHEIGIRMALGAGRRDVLALIFAMGGKLVLIGLGTGLGVSLALAKLLQNEVFEVPGTDLVVLAAVVTMLCGAALLACFVPARRAAKLDPLSALRHE
jgi:putative ABC transport system permease protein